MRLPYGIAFNLACIACLSSFLLATAEGRYWLPVMVLFFSMASFYLTDWTKRIRLPDAVSNTIILLIVLLTVGKVIQQRGEELANGIAYIVVFVQMVLLFKEKSPRNCWHIMLLSFLQVVVASVFQQSIWYAALLLLYVFASICGFCLVFLYRENLYFQSHSFVRSRETALTDELRFHEQDKRRLARIVIATLLTGPVALFLSFGERKSQAKTPENSPDPGKTDSMKNSEHRPSAPAWDADSLWEEENVEPEQEQAAPVFVRRTESGEMIRRSLFAENPRFSGGTRRPGLVGGNRALLGQLLKGTLISLVFAVFVFFLFPRLARVEFGTIMFSYGHWQESPALIRSVGFSDKIQLGSLSNVIQDRREVMNIRFKQGFPSQSPSEMPRYTAMEGGEIYLRGVPLTIYEAGSWSDLARIRADAEEVDETEKTTWSYREAPRWVEQLFGEYIGYFKPGHIFDPEQFDLFPYRRQGDRVTMEFEVRPLDSRVLFAPWPFFQDLRRHSTRIRMRDDRFTVRGRRNPDYPEEYGEQEEHRTTRFALITTVFDNGLQAPITPMQENVPLRYLLQLPPSPETVMPTLVSLAAAWDGESGLPKRDIVGRARFFEKKLSEPGMFHYKLGGVRREPGLDRVEDFLRNNRLGHCEYFASALALMLRSVGIGSRIIVGFKTYCLNANGQGAYVVRQSDAHSWVEVYVPPESLPKRELTDLQPGSTTASWWYGGGWLRLDPTPAPEETLMDGMKTNWTDLVIQVQEFWSEYVLNMEPQKQMNTVYAPILQLKNRFLDQFVRRDFVRSAFAALVHSYKNFARDLAEGRLPLVAGLQLLLPLAVAGLFLGLLVSLFRFVWLRLFHRAIDPATRRRETVLFYLRLERQLARLGLTRRPSQTQREFLAESSLRFPGVPLSWVGDLFYRIRFGGGVLGEEERQRLEALLVRLAETEKNR